MTFFRRRRNEELVEEIDTHLSLLEEEYRRGGMSAESAREAAQRSFGGVLKTRQAYREQSRGRWLDALMQDARFGVRVLLRDRAFALTAIAVLGLGIGVNNMQFTIIYTHTLRPLPIEQVGRVVMASFLDQQTAERNLSYLDYRDLGAGATLFEGLAALGPVTSVALGERGQAPDRYLAAYTTGSAFSVLRIAPMLGRTFTESEELPGAALVAMIDEAAWRGRYRADPGVLGREVSINGQTATIVGVLRDRSGFPSTAQLLLPLAHAPGFSAERRDARLLRAVGRVRNGTSVDEAQAQLRALLQQIGTGDGTSGLLPNVTPITARFRGRASDPAWRAFLAVGFLVVGVASANAANLMLARGAQRAREIAIRGSLGASRRRIIVQFLVESSVLASFGGLAGLAVSAAGARLFESGIPENSMPYWFRYSMDTAVLAALVVISFATVLVFGLTPALQTSRTDVTRVLKDGGWGGTRRAGHRWLSTVFMTAQLALSVVLMSFIAMNVANNRQLPRSDEVIRTAPVLTASISLPRTRYATPEQRIEFFRRLDETVRAMPGVTAASMASHLPRTGGVERRLQRDTGATTDSLPPVVTVMIGPGYFAALGVPMHRGREFSAIEAPGSVTTAIVDERFVEMFLGEGDPIGHVISLAPATSPGVATPAAIVGVVQNVRQRDALLEPVVYLSLAADVPPTMSVLVRTTVDPAAVTAQLRQKVLALDPNLPLFQVMTMPAVIQNADWVSRQSNRLITVLSLIVVLLSGVGLYAVTAHAVTHRSKEIGIRMAVGAQPRQIRRLVLRGAALQVALGLFFGLLFTLAWDGAFFSGRVEARFARPEVLLPVGTVLALVMCAACLIPMRRAAGLDPLETLRRD